MSKVAPFFTLLAEGPDFWTVNGPDTGFVQLLDAKDGHCVGAFAFQVCPDLRDKLGQLLQPFAGSDPARRAKLKIVTDSRLVVAARSAAAGCGFQIEKIVERSGAFEIRFEPAGGRLQVSALEKAREKSRPRIRVMIIDDSPLICSILSNIISQDKDMEVVGTVGHPKEVEAAIEKFRPDVVTLDIYLPDMNGVEVLKEYVHPKGIPAIIFTSVSAEEGPLVLNALEAGAVDYIQKPSAQEVNVATPMILAKLKAAAKIVPRVGTNEIVGMAKGDPKEIDQTRLIAIGSSTGGTKALSEILTRLPKEIPPIVVAQHIPAGFSKAFADRLNAICAFEVCEARHGDVVRAGRVLVAPGGKQMRLVRGQNGLTVCIEESISNQLHKPSVDVLFQSVRETCGPEAVAILLTGMGADGAKSMLALKQNGCATIAQDEASCIVFGMPQAAMQLGAAGKMVPLLGIAQELVNEVSGKNKLVRKTG